jgi:hypothetical protein
MGVSLFWQNWDAPPPHNVVEDSRMKVERQKPNELLGHPPVEYEQSLQELVFLFHLYLTHKSSYYFLK